jgi:SAM-dependent methyltransferase
MNCLGCNSPQLISFLGLGKTPLANSYLDSIDSKEEVYPLSVCFCPECYLVQLEDIVSPEKLYTNYSYFSSYSDEFLDHAKQQAKELLYLGADSSTKVLEIASNDGYLLKYLPYIKVLGIEPAGNIAKEAIANGIPTLNMFFNLQNTKQILESFGQADFIIGNNVLAHVPDINDFIEGVGACLKPDGIVMFEFPYLFTMLNKMEFDTIYHEHVFYYSVLALKKLFKTHSMEIFDIKFSSIHGGSIRIYIQFAGAGTIRSIVSYYELQEKLAGLDSIEYYDDFSTRVSKFSYQLNVMLRTLKDKGAKISAYGAPAKGNTLLNYCGINNELIDFTVDLSPHKQGKFLPGSRIPILAPSELLEKHPSHTLILPWNFKEEIMKQQQEYREQGGKFIIPIPSPKIVK